MRPTLSRLALAITLASLTLVPIAAQMNDKGPALGGYCPVAYTVAGKALRGDPRYASEHRGRRYLFVNADAKKMFDADPAKFTIAFDSWCATAVAYGKKVASDPTLFTVHNAVTYLFSARDAKAAFDKDVLGHVHKADEQ